MKNKQKTWGRASVDLANRQDSGAKQKFSALERLRIGRKSNRKAKSADFRVRTKTDLVCPFVIEHHYKDEEMGFGRRRFSTTPRPTESIAFGAVDPTNISRPFPVMRTDFDFGSFCLI